MTAREFLYDGRASRLAILVIVVAMHLAALLIPLIEKGRPIERDFHGLSSVRLIQEEPRPHQQRPSPKVAPMAGSITSPPPPALAPFALPNEAAVPGSVETTPDWKQSGADAAADAARKSYRALGPQPEQPRIKAPRSPFKPPPKHKRGEIGEDALENPVVWLSEHCYVRLENRKAPPGDPFAQIPMTLCSFPIGKLEPRGDLFEHLRKPQPVP